MDKPMENTYIIVHAWMRSELDLNSNELLVYAAIYGFCQDRKSHFLGGRSYLAAWTGTTKRSVQNNLNSLLEKGLIAKEEKVVNGVKACEYYPVNLPWEDEAKKEQDSTEGGRENISSPGKKVLQGGEKISPGVGKNFPRGREKISPSNIKSNINNYINTSSSSDGTTESAVPPKQKTSEMVVLVAERWNALQEIGIKPVSKISDSSSRRKMLGARLLEYGIEGVLAAIERIPRSRFLRGQNKSGWTITFDWFVRPNNFPKVLEGNYDDPGGDAQKGGCGYGDTGRESGGYPGGGGEGFGRGGGTKEYDPREFLGSLLDT